MPISIRPFKSTDASALQGAVSSSVGHIGPWLDWCTPRYTLKDARAWVNSSIDHWQQGQAFRWAIVGSNDKHILGGVDIYLPVLGQPVGQMGYWVRRDSVGRGICTQAAAQALHWSFDRLGLARVELFVQPDNSSGIAVARKLGAKLQGQQEDQITFNGESRLANHYMVLAKDFELLDLPTAECNDPLRAHDRSANTYFSEYNSIYEFRRRVKIPRA
jgi:RimJ/RimL family protein N-acetyltransferase